MSSRSQQRAKKRKTNLVLNSLIAIVIISILVVSASILGFTNRGDDKQAASQKTEEQTKSSEEMQEKEEPNKANEKEEQPSEDKEETTEEEVDLNAGQEGLVVEESSENNIKTTATNPNWKPVGTKQTNFANSFDQGSVDWNEKLTAVSYATGLPVDNMIVWRVERGADPSSQAVATVTPKDQSENYRVYLQWIDGSGWKPTEVQTLVENDKK